MVNVCKEIDTSVAEPVPIVDAPAGTPLVNVNIFSGRTDPMALKDEEYPDWVWSVLDKKPLTDQMGNPTKYALKKESKDRIKANNQL